MQETRSEDCPSFLERDDGATIAYRRTEGKTPGVVFVHGLKSDMTGGKALAVEDFCKRRGHAFVRFDCYGHGESSGDFVDGTVGRWTGDLLAVLTHLTEGPQVLVGSSMGGWVVLNAAVKAADPDSPLAGRVAGVMGIAPAPDFTQDLMERHFTEAQRREMETKGFVELPNCYSDEPYRIGRALIEDGRKNLLLDGSIAVDCPVRLIHGMRDEDVPWRTSARIIENVRTGDAEVLYVKDGGHRLSEPRDLARMEAVLGLLLDHVAERA